MNSPSLSKHDSCIYPVNLCAGDPSLVLGNPSLKNDLKFCMELLPDVSRTFAIGIKALGPSVLGQSVLIGYLLCRIADTIEDDLTIPAILRAELLSLFDERLDEFSREKIKFFTMKASLALSGDPSHLLLVENTERVLRVFFSLPKIYRSKISRWVREMIAGMRNFTLSYPQGLRIQTLSEFQKYCYYVAGTVGYLLTDLWQVHCLFLTKNKLLKLQERQGAFGEGLQTINILKDICWDYEKEKAIYIPEEILKKYSSDHASFFNTELISENSSAVAEIISLAEKNLFSALEYTTLLPKWHPRVRFFCILPMLLAFATLRELKYANSQHGLININIPVVKITRNEVKKIIKKSVLCVFSNFYLKNLAKHLLDKSDNK